MLYPLKFPIPDKKTTVVSFNNIMSHLKPGIRIIFNFVLLYISIKLGEMALIGKILSKHLVVKLTKNASPNTFTF